MEQMFRRTAQQALEQLDTTTQGLSDAEIAKRRETYGENALAEEKKKSPLVVFLEQFKDLLVIILIAAAVISALSGNGESTIVIVAVITLNAILGTVQHFKAEKSLESLKALSSPSAKVMRNGVKVIETENVDFNTDLHEAVTTIPAPTEEQKGKVIDCIEKGYTLNDKVIRFAKVVVGE